MKRFALLIAVIAAVLTAGCSGDDNNTPGPGPGPSERKPVWESYTHAELLRLKGRVKQLRTTLTLPESEGGEMLLQLTAAFCAAGNCTNYDPTGIELEKASALGKVTRDWGVSAARFTYTYDATGRLTTATKYEVGSDSVTYAVTYGSHAAYIPAPFPLGDIEPFQLKGVTRIESQNYLLTSDGVSATATANVSGWPASIKETTWILTGNLPAEGLTIAYANAGGEKGEEQWRETTKYTYDRSWLIRSEIVKTMDDDDSQRFVMQYSMQWPCSPTIKEGYAGDSTEPEFRMEYEYAENGQPRRAHYTLGMYFDTEFEQHFTAYDNADNWINAIRKQEGGENLLNREIGYY